MFTFDHENSFSKNIVKKILKLFFQLIMVETFTFELDNEVLYPIVSINY